jgi:hypothetical protein
MYRFTVRQYHRLQEFGLVPEGVELIEGLIVVKGHFRHGEPVPFRFDRVAYRRMLELGVLTEDDPVELIDGEVLAQMPQGDPHAVAIERLDRRFQRLLPDEYAVRCQCPVTLSDTNEPEPDLAVCVPAEERGGLHPRPDQLFVVIEVADSSLTDDRGRKGELYARFGIPVYWIVNLEERRIEVYSDPVSHPGSAPNYVTAQDYRSGQDVPVTINGIPVGVIPVDAVLP